MKGWLVSASFTAMLAAAGVAHAQATDDKATEVGEVVVTGTLIRGIAPVGAVPVSLDAEDIQESGRFDTAQVLRTIPQISTLGISEMTTGTGANGGATNVSQATGVNIRGLGTEATLTLINGRRAAPGGAFSNFFEPSVIPTLALGGIEVLTDGASATYGSDAIAGVVNLILKRNMNGGEVQASYGGARGSYEASKLSLAYGDTWDSGQAMFAVERSYHSALYAKDRRDLYIADYNYVLNGNGATPRGQTNFAYFANIRTGAGATTAFFAAAPNANSAAMLTPNAQNVIGIWLDSTIITEQTRSTVTGQFEQKLMDRVKLFGQGFFSHRTFWGLGNNSNAPSTALTVTLPSINPFYIPVPGAAPCAAASALPAGTLCETVLVSGDQFVGAHVSEGEEDAFQLVLGFDVDLFADWKGDFAYTWAGSRDVRRRVNSAFNTCAFTGGATCGPAPAGQITNASGVYLGAVNQSNPQFAFNPFGANSQYVLDRVWADLFQRNHYDMHLYAAKFDGPLFDMPGGKVRAAFGFEYQKDSEGQNNDTGSTALARTPGGASNYVNLKSDISTKTKTAYGEVVVPLIGPDNAQPWAQRFEVAAAVRYSEYSITDSKTTNPKFGVTWVPTDGLNIHATYGTSFRVNLSASDPNAVGLVRNIPNYADYLKGAVNAIQRGGGNPDLVPETATTWTIGVDYQPEQLPGLKIGVTYFNIDYKNILDRPGSAVLSTLTQANETTYAPYIIRRPSSVTTGADDTAFNAMVAALIAAPFPPFSPPVPAVTVPQLIIDGRAQNSGQLKTDGIDFNLSYVFETGFGDWSTALMGTYYFKWDRAFTPTAALQDRLGDIDFPQEYRLRALLGWEKDGFRATAFLNYLPEYDNTSVSLTAPPKIDDYLTVDFSASFDTADRPGLEPLHGIVLSVSVQNLFDKKPPFAVVGNQNYDAASASQLGRFATMSISKKF